VGYRLAQPRCQRFAVEPGSVPLAAGPGKAHDPAVCQGDIQAIASDGHPVAGEGGPLTATPGATLSPEGSLLDAEGNEIGRLKVVEFGGPEILQQLQREGRNLYAVPDGVAPRNREDVAVLPGFLEDSNVDSVAALAEMVILQRAFQTNLEALRADDLATESLIRRFSE